MGGSTTPSLTILYQTAHLDNDALIDGFAIRALPMHSHFIANE